MGTAVATAYTMARENEEDGSTVFRPGTAASSPVRTVVALALWLGAIHFNLLLVLASVFVFPGRIAALVLGTQLLFMFAPVSNTNGWGRNIARFICKHAADYFPITLHVVDYNAFDPNTAYVFGYEPHCAMPLGLWVLAAPMGFMPLPKMKILASSAAFYTPFQRQIWTWLGLVPASRKNFSYYLGAGYSCAVVPGGLREMRYMDHESDSEVAFIRSRKGFVRIAIQTGCPLVPVFCFGQDRVYNWWRPGSNLLVKIAGLLKAPAIVFWGKFGTFIPFRLPMHVFVGRPIEVTKNNQPTMDEINEVHEKFVMALQELFNKHKYKVGCPNLQLQVI
ncbi:hypothetical protein CFC21_055419 [Triticum aestivum]|uniref:Acyltransferase n=2 Tax=Triticum aestivum TaxID=4565 RepID=A0A3B6I2U3_WHEAT|nr:diacylglycerol O-acyltransferase 2D-like isoform X1 [Triticum aestivum]KAF7046388.1 hypothetical protein CFC21_055419 [Triticum aestivum]